MGLLPLFSDMEKQFFKEKNTDINLSLIRKSCFKREAL